MRFKIWKYTINITNMSFADDCNVWNIGKRGNWEYQSYEFVLRIWSKTGFTYRKYITIPYRFNRISAEDRKFYKEQGFCE